jgi:hypothetical protein
VSEAGENVKFLMTIESLVTGVWPADDAVAVALVDEAAEGTLELLELLELLEHAVSATTRTSPGSQSQLR